MRIALVTREYPPETAWGGIGSFYAGLARALVEAGHEVEVFTQGLTQAGTERIAGIQVTRVLAFRDGFGPGMGGSQGGSDDLGLFALGLARAMHRAVTRRHAQAPFDIIESHEHLGIGAAINSDPALSALTVVRYHTAYDTLVRRAVVDWPASPLITALERAALENAAQRVAVSQSIDRIAGEDFGADPAQSVIPNFVDAPPWQGRWTDKKNQILFVGRLVLNLKRPDIAVDAFVRFARRHPGWTLKLVGLDQEQDGIGSVWAHLSAQIPSDLKDRIDFLGARDPTEVFDLMAQSKAILVPSEFESFGLVVAEAMLHGCLPLVASGVATADIVPDVRLVRTRGSAEDFAAGLQILFGGDAQSETQELSSRVVAYAGKAFSQARLVEANIGLYQRMIEARESRAAARPPATPGQPLVSVVIPNFNGARFLDETLASVVSQDYPNLEIILVDGNSSDHSLEIAAAYPQIQVISQPDRGQAHAINRGLLRARGDILAYLNSDDVYRPGAVSTVVAHFQKRPEARMLCGAADQIDARSGLIGDLIVPRFSGLSGVIRYWGWGRWHTLPQMACFWRREVVERVGLFDAGLHFVMDLDYWIRTARLFDIGTVPETLAAFRLVEGTKTVSSTDKMYAEEYATFLRYRNLLPPQERASASREARHHYSGKLLGWGEHLYLSEHLRRQGLGQARLAVSVDPARLFDPRVWFLAGNAALSVIGLGGWADRAHRRLLSVLPRLSLRAAP